jgi:ribose transport system permease protein
MSLAPLLGKLRHRQVQRSIANLLALLAIGLVVQARTGDFFTSRNLESLCVQIVVVAIIASAETLVMVAGNIDVSVSGIAVLTGIVAGLLAKDMPLAPAFALATLVGLTAGYLNALMVVRIGITSLIATIGMLYVSQGAANLLTNGIPIAGLPTSFSTIGNGFAFGGVPWALPMILLVGGAMAAIQRWTVLGRHAVAAGSNARAAFLAGVNVNRTITLCFCLSGAAAGWGGVVYASRIGAPVPVVDNDLLFQVIVACVVGGTSLTGGEGSVIGSIIGAVLVGALNNGLDLLGVSTYWQDVALGLLLVLAVGLDVGLRRDSVFNLRRRIAAQLRVRRETADSADAPPPDGYIGPANGGTAIGDSAATPAESGAHRAHRNGSEQAAVRKNRSEQL